MVTKEGSEQPVGVGCRICCDGECGTVLFVGEIDSQEGTWLGIEWDNPARGKHSGTYKGISYFHTSIENAGSFIRPWKAESGISCPEAIRQKYGDESAAGSTDVFHLPQKSGKLRVIEVVGFNKVAVKQSQFDRLTEVAVSMMQVNGPGAKGEMEDLVPNVTNLDLSCNLLKSWSDIAAIVEQLVVLKCLVLSKNRLKIENEMERYNEAFDGVETLVLNDMNYDWCDVLKCGASWPNVKTLYLCSNRISSLEVPAHPLFASLKCLSLEHNSISSWEEIIKLGNLANLEELYLDNSQLEFISFMQVKPTETTDLFPQLAVLSLKSNRLARWRDISELNKLQSLKELKIFDNPVIDSVTPETARQLVIAKIPNLQILNRSVIERNERKGAEIDYIKRFHREWIASGGQKDFENCMPSLEFLSEHPTYISLVRKHGAAEDGEVAPRRVLLKNNLISVEFFSPQAPDRPPVIKKLPVTMLVCKVKALVRRMFSIPVQDEIKMTCVVSSDAALGSEMENDLRELGYYCCSDDDRVEVTWQ